MDETHCFVYNGSKICGNRASTNIFKRDLDVSIDTKKMYIFEPCRTKSLNCFDSNIKTVKTYIPIFMIALLITNFLHESFHFLVFYLSGETIYGLSFNISGGITYVESLDVSGHSIYWWYLATMGPLLFVNFIIMVISFKIGRINKTNERLYTEFITLEDKKYRVFIMSMAYISAITILSNTILASFVNIIFAGFGITRVSDLEIAWHISYMMTHIDAIIFRIMVLVSVSFEVFYALYFMFVYGKRGF